MVLSEDIPSSLVNTSSFNIVPPLISDAAEFSFVPGQSHRKTPWSLPSDFRQLLHGLWSVVFEGHFTLLCQWQFSDKIRDAF